MPSYNRSGLVSDALATVVEAGRQIMGRLRAIPTG